MTKKNTWQEFFDAHAPVYDQNDFTKNTIREVDFLLEELGVPDCASILDVGCGSGRHSVELAKRGYAVTGLDLSAEMLAKAAESADTAGVHVEWIHSDATQFSFPATYDAAVCLCEGAFGLLGQQDDPIEQPLADPAQHLPKPEATGKGRVHCPQRRGHASEAPEQRRSGGTF